MKVSSTKLKITPNIFPAYLFLSPIWLLLQPSYAITLCLTIRFYYVTLYRFSQRSSSVSCRKSTLDQHPKTHSSKYERGHANIFFNIDMWKKKYHATSPMLAKGPISMLLHRYVQSLETAQHIGDSASPSCQTSLLSSLETLSKILDHRLRTPKAIDNFVCISSVDPQKVVIYFYNLNLLWDCIYFFWSQKPSQPMI